MTGFGAAVGLDYMAVESVMNILEIKDRKQMLEDLQIMEFAALRVLNERAKA
jgi:hypothetical protein